MVVVLDSKFVVAGFSWGNVCWWRFVFCGFASMVAVFLKLMEYGGFSHLC